MAVSISNIPRKWDVVSDVIYSNNNTRAKIIFNTGASITVKVANEDDFSDPVVSVSKKSKVKINKIQSKPVLTPVQQEAAYRQQAMAALREMGGGSQASLKAAMMTPLVDPAFELMKQKALAESQSRSEKLATEMTPLVPANMPVNENVADNFYFQRQTT